MSNELLNELNAFRANDGKEAFKDWRKARHMPMLEQYRNDAGAVKAKRVDDEIADAFEASADELAAQVGRESADIARDEALVTAVAKPSDDKKVRKQRVGEHVETVAPIKGGVVINTSAISYKEMTRHEKSLVEKPFNLVHSFLDANPTLGRKAAVAALVEQGVNYYTARTQYQRWFTKQKEAK